MNKLIFLPLVLIILLCSLSIAEEESFIIVNAINPEGIEIGSIEYVWWDGDEVKIYDGETLIGYGAYDEETANTPIPISPGQHTIKVIFNGMTLERSINLATNETKRLIFTFQRRFVYDLSNELASDFDSKCDASETSIGGPFAIEAHNSFWYGKTCKAILKSSTNIRGQAYDVKTQGSYSASISYTLSGNSYSGKASVFVKVDSGDGEVIVEAGHASVPPEGFLVPATSPIPPYDSFKEWYIQYVREGDYPTFTVSDQDGNNRRIVFGGQKEDGLEGYDLLRLPASKSYTEFGIIHTLLSVYVSNLGSGYESESEESGKLIGLRMSSVPYDLLGTGVRIIYPPQVTERSCSEIYKYIDDAIKFLPTKAGTTLNHFVTDDNPLLTRDLIKALILRESQYHQLCHGNLIGTRCVFGDVLPSRTGFLGLMQLGGSGWQDINKWLGTNFSRDKPDENVKLGVAYLNWILNAYFSPQATGAKELPPGGFNSEDGNIPFALAAYNCGPPRFNKLIMKYCVDKGIKSTDCTWTKHIKPHITEKCDSETKFYPGSIIKSLESAKSQNNYDFCSVGRKDDKKIKQRVKCPVNLTIIDEYNRTLNNVTNEIPDAFFEQDGDEKTAYLPYNLSYTTIVQAYGSGNFTLLTMFWPDLNTTGLTSLENIQVNPNTQVKQIIQAGIPDNDTKIDHDGDGVFEKNLTGNLSIFYPTQINIMGNLSAISSGSVNVIASLSQYSGKPIPNKTITFALGDQTVEARTDKDGLINLTLMVTQEPGQYLLYADFEGDTLYLPSFEISPFDILNVSLISFKKGWNLVSIPLQLFNNSVDYVFKGLNLTIYGYNGSWFVPKRISNDLAYWVKVNNNVTFVVNGSVIENKTISMQKGWNPIDYFFSTNNITTALSAIEGCYNYVYYWNGPWRSFSPLRPFSQNGLQNMTFGRSYWVQVNCSQINWTY